jgi:hypothetical protein
LAAGFTPGADRPFTAGLLRTTYGAAGTVPSLPVGMAMDTALGLGPYGAAAPTFGFAAGAALAIRAALSPALAMAAGVEGSTAFGLAAGLRGSTAFGLSGSTGFGLAAGLSGSTGFGNSFSPA